MTPTRYMTTDQCAAYLGRTVKAVQCLVQKGHIPHFKVGRRVQFDRERIDRWMGQYARRGAQL
jgi:excisionase family DNA binding protein